MKAFCDDIPNAGAVRCFILEGEDTVSRGRAREAVIAGIEKDGGPCVRESFDPAVEPAALFAQRMLTPSLFAGRRIFLFRHAQGLEDEDLDELDAALSGSPDDVYCIIEIDEEKKGAVRAHKRLHIGERTSGKPPTACLRRFDRPREWETAGWLVSNTPLLIGRKISGADAAYLVERSGNDLDTLHSELQKIDLYLPPSAPVTRTAIDHVAGPFRLATPFELADALGSRDFPRVVEVIEALFSVAVSMPLVTAIIGRRFWAMFRIKKFLAGNPETERRFTASRGGKNPVQTETGLAIGRAAGLLRDGEEHRIFPVIVKSGIVEQTKRFSEEELAAILSWLTEFDADIKTGRAEQTKSGLQALCYRIVRARVVLEQGGGGR
jgi:DNA polymerase III delta subunit